VKDSELISRESSLTRVEMRNCYLGIVRIDDDRYEWYSNIKTNKT